MSFSSLRQSVWVVVLGLCVSAAPAAYITVDDFSDGVTDLTVYDGAASDSDSDAGLSGVIGGQRDVDVVWTEGPGDVTVRINFRSFSSFVAFAEGPATTGEVTLGYGGGGDLGADLTDSGANDRLRMTFNTADILGEIDITVETSGVGSSAWSGSTPAGINNVDTTFDVLFSAFAGSADFSDVDAIEIVIAGGHNGDYVIKDVGAVPEPMTVSVLALGATAMLIRRRR